MGNERLLQPALLNTIFDNANAYICVSDIQTGEILFLNNKMKTRWGLDSKAEKATLPAEFQSGFEGEFGCSPAEKLLKSPQMPAVWEEHDQRTGKYYKNTGSVVEWNGRGGAFLLYSTEITDIRLTEISLKKQLKQQKLMSAISQKFATAQDAPSIISEALKMAGEFMNVNQSFLAKYQEAEGCLECIYEWYDENGAPYIGNESRWPISPEMEFYRELTAQGFAAVDDYRLLTHPNFKTVKDYKLRAFLNIPIEIAGEFWGIIGFIINTHTYSWTESDIYLGKLIAGVFSGVISRNETEKMLLQAKETAEQASKAKGDFLSCMSHEMRTPMNAIIGMTRIAKKSGDLQKMEYCLERIDTASKHLLGIINDILDISKIEVNKLELSPVEFDFERMLRNITGVVNFRAEDKDQTLIINIGSDLPPVFTGDEMRLSQVIVNLISNAVKFTPEGGTITLNARCREIRDDTATVLFEVIDNGIGISEEQKAKLFAPFVQADGGIARKYGGTGLGLTISKGIVELMGGRIWIESDFGQGSKFSFTVKMKAVKGLPKQKLADTISKENTRILIITQTAPIRDFLTRVFTDLDLYFDITENENAAAEIISGNKADSYNIFLIDRRTTELNDFNLIKKIRRLNKDNKIILAVSETDWSNIETNAVAAGVNSFVFKPLFQSSIVEALNKSAETFPCAGESGAESHTYDFQSHGILIAEDIEINREIISAILEETGISVDFAQDGIEAVSMYKSNPLKYSLILMDIQMPEMDGYEATKNIRSAMTGNRIPIIAMTANVFREDIDKCLEAGMDDHIGKPLDTKELLSKLENYLV